MIDEPARPLNVFYSYAHKDAKLRDELGKHLFPLKRQGLIVDWYDRDISAGKEWEQEIDDHLNSADIILILISSDFLASEYCYGIELKRAIERHDAGEARVIPILLKPVDWQGSSFHKLQALPKKAKAVTKWTNQAEAFAEIAKGIREVVPELRAQLSLTSTTASDSFLGEIHAATSSPPDIFPQDPMQVSEYEPVWYVPFRRNPLFTGRKEILERLRHAFTANGQATPTMLVLSGMGGIGKTQTALEYAYLYKDDYLTVLWAKADSPEILNTDFASFAGLLNLPGEREQDQKYAVDAVKRWLEVHTNWLLILDNVEDLDMINDYLPPAPQGHILLTSYRQVAGGMAFRLEIDKMTPEEGILFLLNRTGFLVPGASIDKASETDRQIASIIVDEMDGLPLAIDQAGAYIEKSACGLSGFLELYKERRGELLRRRGGIASGHPEPVTTTLALSFAKIEQANLAAAELLRFFAFLHPDAIFDELIRKGASQLGPLLEAEAAEILTLNDMIGELNNYSLVRRSTASILSIHRLVQAVIRDNLRKEAQSDWAERTVRAVNQAFPKVEFITWQQCRRYLPHAQVSAGLIKQEHMIFPEAARLLDEAGYYLFEQGQYQEAEPLLMQAVAIREQTLGSEHLDMATSLNHLAELYREQAKYEQAEPLYLRALAIQESHLELAPHDLATILNNLGLLYNSQAKYAQSKQFCQRALDLRMNILGPEHPDTATSLNNLAELYQDEGQFVRARPLFERALAICEKTLGPEHPDTATSLSNLAVFYSTQRRYREAEPLFERALAICEEALGLQHPTTVKVLESYIAMLRQANRNTRVKELKKRLETTNEEQTYQENASESSVGGEHHTSNQ
jgi:tetratricopeptide (TPR) repeat protein